MKFAISFILINDDEISKVKENIIFVDENNKVIE